MTESTINEPYRVIPLSPMRKVIAARMTEAKQTIPHFRVAAEFDVEALMALRQKINADNATGKTAVDASTKISLNDLIVKACAMALMDVPAINSQLVGNEIHRYSQADISVVVSVEDGLTTPIVRSANGKRHLDFKGAMAKLRKVNNTKEFGFEGPPSAVEWLESIEVGAGNIALNDAEWQRHSGVLPASGAAHEHRSGCETIRLAMSVDELGVSMCAFVENLVRRLIQIEIAVERNPTHPDYRRLGVMVDGTIGESRAARAPKFTSWVTEKRKEQANIMRQDRLWAEEKRFQHGSEKEQPGRGVGRGRDGKTGRGRKGRKGDADEEDDAG